MLTPISVIPASKRFEAGKVRGKLACEAEPQKKTAFAAAKIPVAKRQVCTLPFRNFFPGGGRLDRKSFLIFLSAECKKRTIHRVYSQVKALCFLKKMYKNCRFLILKRLYFAIHAYIFQNDLHFLQVFCLKIM